MFFARSCSTHEGYFLGTAPIMTHGVGVQGVGVMEGKGRAREVGISSCTNEGNGRNMKQKRGCRRPVVRASVCRRDPAVFWPTLRISFLVFSIGVVLTMYPPTVFWRQRQQLRPPSLFRVILPTVPVHNETIKPQKRHLPTNQAYWESIKKAFYEPRAAAQVDGKDRRSSFPFITGDTFREMCTFRCERPGWRQASCDFKAGDIVPQKNGDAPCIFIATTDLRSFRTTTAYLHAFDHLRSGIRYPYVLVTHNGDLSVPEGDNWHPHEKNPREWKESFGNWLHSPLLLAWFASNCNWKVGTPKPPKLSCIPLGLENRYNSRGKALTPEFFFPAFTKSAGVVEKRALRVLVDFKRDDKWKPDRAIALRALADQPYTHRVTGLSHMEWKKKVRGSAFVACPHGHGKDSHRLWEVLLLGSYPVVQTSTLDELYVDLPVLIVPSWSNINARLLEEKHKEFEHNYPIHATVHKRLFFPHWRSAIQHQMKQGRLQKSKNNTTHLNN